MSSYISHVLLLLNHSRIVTSQGRTLYVGSSHLVPLDMVNEPPRYGPEWETQHRRRIRRSYLPPGPMDVCGGRTIVETVPLYREWTRDLATWRSHCPDPITRAVILLGGKWSYQPDPRKADEPKHPKEVLLLPHLQLWHTSSTCHRNRLQCAQAHGPVASIRTTSPLMHPMHRATHPVCYDYPIDIINDRIRDSMSSNQLIPLNFHLHAWPRQSFHPPPTGKLENRADICCLAVPPLNGIQRFTRTRKCICVFERVTFIKPDLTGVGTHKRLKMRFPIAIVFILPGVPWYVCCGRNGGVLGNNHTVLIYVRMTQLERVYRNTYLCMYV